MKKKADAPKTALCFGWIDGQVRTHDEKTFVRKFTPRRARPANGEDGQAVG
jgi:uncharacterized protein YdeI (YjbR/CyaY-like superfamily)